MKYIYINIVGKIATKSPGGLFQAVELAQREKRSLTDEDYKNLGKMDYSFGACFIPENGDPFEHPLEVTNYDVIKSHIKTNHDKDNSSYLEQFFGATINPNAGFMDDWTEELTDDPDAFIYYVLMEDGPHQIILTIPDDLGLEFGGLTKIMYLVNINDKIMICTPDIGDYLFNTLEEANGYYGTYLNEIRERERLARQEEVRKQRELNRIKNVEELGDGTYVGYMMGCMFYYDGQQFKCPFGIRQSHPANKIIKVINGKAEMVSFGTYDDWLSGK